ARLAVLGAIACRSAAVAVTAALRRSVPYVNVKDATLLAYQTALCVLAGASLAVLLRAPWERAAVTDLVGELVEKKSGTLRDALARALGDPTLEVAYRLPSGLYVDASGQPVDLPVRDPDRRVTRLER